MDDMKEFYSCLEEILFASSVKQKIEGFKEFYDDFLCKKVVFDDSSLPKLQIQPSYASFCEIVHPTKISRPKSPSSNINLARIVHSIAHIEYCAIDLALDGAYRFRGLLEDFYTDWLCVAAEEIKHFSLLEEILIELGFNYGDFAVHNNLYNAMTSTRSSLFERMGLLHRGLEATGLDANPFVVLKIQSSSHCIKPKILQALDIILRDEISHVRKGDLWWKYSNLDNIPFIVLLEKFRHFNLIPKALNVQARLQAGFTQDEIDEMIRFGIQSP